MRIMHRIDTNTIRYKDIIFVDVDGTNKIIRGVWLTTIILIIFFPLEYTWIYINESIKE